MRVQDVFSKKETSIALVIIVLSVLITLANSSFLTYRNIMDILRSYAVHGIVATGMLLVIITAGIDVSVGECSCGC